jgi:hypothetical protein
MDRLASITGRVARPDPGQELGSRPRVGFSNQTLARSIAYDTSVPLNPPRQEYRCLGYKSRKLAPGRVCRIGLFRHVQQTTQRFAAARQARAHSADWHAQNLRSRLIGHPFETDKQDDFALFVREAGKGALEFAQLAGCRGVRRRNERRRHLFNIDGCLLSHGVADHVHVLVVHDGEKPGPDVRAGLP